MKRIVLLTIISFLACCRKYPEGGPVKTHRAKFKEDHWGIHKYIVNGIDSTSLISSVIDNRITKSYVHFFESKYTFYWDTYAEGESASIITFWDDYHVQFGSDSAGTEDLGKGHICRKVLSPQVHLK